ncbi:hypothetical protein AVEN_32713-1, partial [Araneus ventricosus]
MAFQSPAAPWYGGWWERMICLIKQLLREVLKRACVTYEEMVTLLCESESVVKGRPLTCLYNDPIELRAIKPLDFIQDIEGSETVDLDIVDAKHLRKRIRYLQNLRCQLRQRFQKEYLAELIQNPKLPSKRHNLSPGDVILVGSDNTKRLNWPSGRAIELFQGKDNIERVAKLRVTNGEIICPIQRIHPYEMSSTEISKAYLKILKLEIECEQQYLKLERDGVSSIGDVTNIKGNCKMASKGNLNVHVTFGTSTCILISSRKDFLKKISEKFNLDEDEIEILDIKNKKFIGIDDLKDFIKVEIKKKTSYALNGRSHSLVPHVSKEPDRKELVQKLLDNRVLTGKERAFLVDLLEDSYHPPLKRRKEDDSVRPEMKNRKVQVDAANLIATKTAYTQTDELIHYKPSLNTSIAANDIITQSKRLASEDKIDAAAANNLMSKSFDKRRNFILIERPFTSFVKEKYPLLFSNAEVKNEVDRIFYVGKYSEFLGNIEKYAPHILSIARDDDPLLLATRHKMDGFKTPAQKK